jgi:hypothetical protein
LISGPGRKGHLSCSMEKLELMKKIADLFKSKDKHGRDYLDGPLYLFIKT